MVSYLLICIKRTNLKIEIGNNINYFQIANHVGWLWSSINFWPNIFYNNLGYKDAREYVKTEFGIDLPF